MFETLLELEHRTARQWAPPLVALTVSAWLLFWQSHFHRLALLDPRQMLWLAGRSVLFAFLSCLLLCVLVAGLLRAREGTWIGLAALRWASSAVWLTPLVVLIYQRSPLVVVAAGVLAISLARQTRWHWQEIAGTPEPEGPVSPTPFALIEPHGWYGRFAGAVCTAAVAQGALVAHLIRARLAEVLLACGALAVLTWRALGVAPVSSRNVDPWLAAGRKMVITVAIAFLAVCFCLTTHLRRVPGEAGAVSALAGWLRALHGLMQPSQPSQPTEQAERGARKLRPDASLGDDYPGIIAFPEMASHTVLVPPPLVMANGGIGSGRLQKLRSIPFFGSYWFFREPHRRPPKNSVTMVADPVRRGFFTRDRTLLDMEAHQNLGVDVELACCREIAVWIRNADRHRVWLELILMDTQTKGRPRLSLGWQEVNPAPWSATEPVTESVRFPVPRRGPIRHFDELLVVFHRDLGRGTRSAKVALERFVFVP